MRTGGLIWLIPNADLFLVYLLSSDATFPQSISPSFCDAISIFQLFVLTLSCCQQILFYVMWHQLETPLWLIRWFLWWLCLYVRACHVLHRLWCVMRELEVMTIVVAPEWPRCDYRQPNSLSYPTLSSPYQFVSQPHVLHILTCSALSCLYLFWRRIHPGRLFECRLHIHGKILLVLFVIFVHPVVRNFVVKGKDKTFMGDDENFWLSYLALTNQF